MRIIRHGKTRINQMVGIMKRVLMTGVLVAGLAATSLQAGTSAGIITGNAEKGKEKAGQICHACHGLDGNGMAAQPIWPKLAGQHPNYIYKQLNNFKNNDRYNVQMSPMAMPLTDEDMRNVAAYYSSLPQSGGVAAADQVELGEKIYRAGNPKSGVPACSGCHGPSGMGTNLSKFPRLAGQYPEYIDQTLKLFRKMERANDPNGMMRGVAARMTDEEIAAVAQYISGLHQ
ncbi:cytochrome c553 [Thiorhodovibrio frisius]|uniref:Cytochrome c553 n=1 Tax=Thiorhodovibrio frisius TaxID=631362 RepID=H8Z1E8_9GAMM|nr:cytochrome c553 [Thiorhodovibrio frisius]WPL24797.1 Cytochrome c4 [Thiorhodovibrio frisius]